MLFQDSLIEVRSNNTVYYQYMLVAWLAQILRVHFQWHIVRIEY